jgi:hypothetical protein
MTERYRMALASIRDTLHFAKDFIDSELLAAEAEAEAKADAAPQVDGVSQNVRELIELAWTRGYYHAGYTHDSAYAEMKAKECATELLAAPQPAQAQEDGPGLGIKDRLRSAAPHAVNRDLLLNALEIGLDCAEEVAQTTHQSLAGYKPHRHAAVDADVETIKSAIVLLAAPQPAQKLCGRCLAPEAQCDCSQPVQAQDDPWTVGAEYVEPYLQENLRIECETLRHGLRLADNKVLHLEMDAARYRFMRKPESGSLLYAMASNGECGRNMDITIDQHIDAALSAHTNAGEK